MDIIATEPPPPGFHEVHKAFDTARELPLWRDAPVSVGVCRGDGSMVATGVLQDHRQARLFCIQMTALGYAELQAQDGFDRVYVPERWHAGRVSAPALEAAH
jgi:hypothetical protein